MSIISLYQGILSKLIEQGKDADISKEMKSITSNDERVLYVYYVIRALNSFPDIVEVHKTEDVSMHYRKLGNKYFQRSEDYKAWQYYNLSILHAPSHSDHYVLALANRSAVFFSMKKYEGCLKDVAKVLSMKHPERLRDKLVIRQTACHEALSKISKQYEIENSAISDVTTMKDIKNKTYLCASSKLKVVSTKEAERHVVAKEDINVGEILAQEDPYLVVIKKQQLLFGCSYCSSRELHLLPCDNCCFTLYCSEKCKEKAWQEYHKIECLLMPTLLHMEFTEQELLALRIVIKARTDHENWTALFNTIRKAEAFQNTEYRGCVITGSKWVFDSKYYTSIHTLANNIEKSTLSEIFQKTVTAAVFLKLLGDATDFLNCDDDVNRDKIRRCVGGTILLHLMMSPANMHGLSVNIATKDKHLLDQMTMAIAPYAFLSLLKHSCTPNVFRSSILGSSKISLVALRPIKKGMQIVDEYGLTHFACTDRQTRQSNIKLQYKFTCTCEACVNDWPIYPDLNPASNLPEEIKQKVEKFLIPEMHQIVFHGNNTLALELFKPLCELAEALDPYRPCKELAECQELLKHCFTIFEGTLPYQMTDLQECFKWRIGFDKLVKEHECSKLVEWKAIPPKA